MTKRIHCCIPWIDYCDFPLARKLIKEKLSKCMHQIDVVVSPYPHALGISESDSRDFGEWLRDDLRGYANVVSIHNDHAPLTTKWSGNQTDGTYKHGYGYPFEYVVDRCEVDYVARIETDYITFEWDKIQSVFNEDFDFISNGAFHRDCGDISFMVWRKDYLLSLPDIHFLEIEKPLIHFGANCNNGEYANATSQPYCIVDNHKDVLSADTTRVYDQYQRVLMQSHLYSNKTYVINHANVKYAHLRGMSTRYYGHLRNLTLHNDQHDMFIRYIDAMNQEIDINNYNLFEPFKKIVLDYYPQYNPHMTRNFEFI